MAAPAIGMPTRGERAAPTFDKSKPRELVRFFDDLELLFTRALIASETEKKKFVVYYVDFETEQTWRALPEFSDNNKLYNDLKDEILKHYPDATGDYVYSIRDMDMLIGERQRIGFNNSNELAEFHLQFLAITSWLIQKQQLSDLEQKRSYVRAFQQPFLAAVNNRLQMKFLSQHPNVPYEIKDVYEAARYLIHSTMPMGNYFASSVAQQTAPPVTILQRPAAPVSAPISQAPTIKTEDFGSMFADFTKTFMDVINKNLRGPANNPQIHSSTSHSHDEKLCHMCKKPGHFIDNCPVVDEFITAGKCKRNQEGKVVLPSGSFVPREITGSKLMDRINEYHRRNPNQLAAVALIHTIASGNSSPPAVIQSHASYQLSAEDRIATLEAELFGLRNRQQAPATAGIRTRAQRAREPEEPAEEIISPAAKQSIPVSAPAVPRAPAPAVPRASVPEPRIVTIEREKSPRIVEEPEHPYQHAKDAAYVPPASRNVGAPAKAPAAKKPEPAYKTLPPVHDAAIAVDVYKRSMEAPITITQRELLSLSPEVRSQVRDVTTTRRVPVEQQAQAKFFAATEQEESLETPAATAFAFQNTSHRVPPEGSTIIPDPIESYYRSLGRGQPPDIGRLTVARDATAIRSLFALVDNSQRIECTIDPGCQIVAMAEAVCNSLGLPYDPDIKLNMESANGTFDWSLGLARNVPFVIGNITLYFQVHVISSPSYAILLGRPFDVLTESVIRNFANEDQTITITDPNSGRQSTIPTFPRGVHFYKQDFQK